MNLRPRRRPPAARGTRAIERRSPASPLARPPGVSRRGFITFTAFFALFGLAAWAGSESERAAPAAAPVRTVRVLAAASLVPVLPELLEPFERAAGVDVSVDYGPTSILARQVEAGMAADVLLSADDKWARWLEERSLAARRADGSSETQPLLRNTLVVVVPKSATFKPKSLGDLADPRVRRLGLAEESVPLGRYADRAMATVPALRALDERVVRGRDARGVLGWAAAGEVDAAIVYRSDAVSEPRVQVAFTVAPELHDPVVYFGVVLAASKQPSVARDLVSFFHGASAAEVLARHGFEPLAPPR